MKKIKCSTGEVCETYPQYLRSKHWRNVKKTYYATHKYKCTKCGHRKNLQLHHTTYARVGHERMSDLIPLCVRCHRAEHGITKLRQPLKKKVKRRWSWKVHVLIIALLFWWIVMMWSYQGK